MSENKKPPQQHLMQGRAQATRSRGLFHGARRLSDKFFSRAVPQKVAEEKMDMMMDDFVSLPGALEMLNEASGRNADIDIAATIDDRRVLGYCMAPENGRGANVQVRKEVTIGVPRALTLVHELRHEKQFFELSPYVYGLNPLEPLRSLKQILFMEADAIAHEIMTALMAKQQGQGKFFDERVGSKMFWTLITGVASNDDPCILLDEPQRLRRLLVAGLMTEGLQYYRENFLQGIVELLEKNPVPEDLKVEVEKRCFYGFPNRSSFFEDAYGKDFFVYIASKNSELMLGDCLPQDEAQLFMDVARLGRMARHDEAASRNTFDLLHARVLACARTILADLKQADYMTYQGEPSAALGRELFKLAAWRDSPPKHFDRDLLKDAAQDVLVERTRAAPGKPFKVCL